MKASMIAVAAAVAVAVVAVFSFGYIVGGERAAEAVRNELFQQQCTKAGGIPAFGGRHWDCLGVRRATY